MNTGLTKFTEEERITMALESATEAIRTLRRKLDIATETLDTISRMYPDELEMEAANSSMEALTRIENEQ